MATSAATLQDIFDLCAKEYRFDSKAAIGLCAAAGYLPKKMTASAKPKATKDSIYASKVALEFAEEHDIDPHQLKGTAKNGRLSIKDLKESLKAGMKAKISPAAEKYARDNDYSFFGLTPAKGDKLLLADIKTAMAASKLDSDSEDEEIKISPAAKRAMKKYGIDLEDLENMVPSGKRGEVLLSDLKEMIADLE